MEKLESFVEANRIQMGEGVNVFINPGTGPVEGATEENALANIHILLIDAGINHDTVEIKRKPKKDSDGRYRFLLKKDGRKSKVDMPGLPLDRVRFMGTEEQDIWNFPRLYVDESSWVWLFAKDIVGRVLSGYYDE